MVRGWLAHLILVTPPEAIPFSVATPHRGWITESNCPRAEAIVYGRTDVSGREDRTSIGAICPSFSVVSEECADIIGDRPPVGCDPVWKIVHIVPPRPARPRLIIFQEGVC